MVTMDETNTANSSSAAAVADGASAAARTKTVGASTVKSASHVKLLIKSSNQQYEDHVIESDLLWTVKRLKTHLSVVYPSKPVSGSHIFSYSYFDFFLSNTVVVCNFLKEHISKENKLCICI